MVEWFAKELEGITSGVIKAALKDAGANPSRAKIIAAVLNHWYEGDPSAIKFSAEALCGATPLYAEVGTELLDLGVS